MLIAAIAVLALAAIRLVHRSRHRVPGCQADRTLLATDNLAVLSIALHKLRLDCGRFPSTTEGLVSLIHNPGLAGWDGPYIFELKPDPWQRHFEYRGDGHTFVVFSAGPDGIPDSPDDITPPPRAGETFPGAVPARYAP